MQNSVSKETNTFVKNNLNKLPENCVHEKITEIYITMSNHSFSAAGLLLLRFRLTSKYRFKYRYCKTIKKQQNSKISIKNGFLKIAKKKLFVTLKIFKFQESFVIDTF